MLAPAPLLERRRDAEADPVAAWVIEGKLLGMQLQPVATEAHVRRALDLFTVSTMDAVKSGVMEAVVRVPYPSNLLPTVPCSGANRELSALFGCRKGLIE